ncbi:MAG: arylesterase [Alphaproteobacteria bacterium]|nr:arylesterase [Alphaproteobacteria bacterium]MCB9931614.1 arylesterase [Alphaproteobacteria bacterium]
MVCLPPLAEAAGKRLLLLGDSLTAGYGLPTEDGFAAQLQRALADRGLDVAVLNAGVSGDTSAGGLARLDWSLAEKPTHAVVELGANDALRGLSPQAMEQNLDAIIRRLQEAGVTVLLAGMRAPANLGPDYRDAFEGAYTRLAAQYGIGLYPFFLKGLPGHPELIQSDGLHPNVAGVAVIVANILPAVETLLAKEQAR